MGHGLRRARGTPSPGDPRSPARAAAVRRGARRAATAQPARRLQAPARAARGRIGRRADRRALPALRTARRAARRGRPLAGALPGALVGPARRPRTTPGGEPGMNGTLETIDGRPALRFERRLAFPIERVWRAVTEPAELAEWFVAPAPWTPAQGETFESYGQTGTITELREPETLAWTWGDESFRFDLRPDDEDCVLVFTHVLTDTILPAKHAAGWECYLDRLAAHLDGAPISEEDAHWRIGETHERYAAKFGLDPSPGRQMIASFPFRMLTLEDGHRLRLQRRYARSAERVWRALTDPAERARWFPSAAPLEVTLSEPFDVLIGTWAG